MTYIGIDISKSTFDAAIPHQGRLKVESFDNCTEGFAQFARRLPEGATCVMEASGPYGFRLAYYLHARGIAVALVNPLVIRRYAQMMLARTKTDKADAMLITSYAEKMMPERWLPASQDISDLQQQRTALEQLTKQRTQLKNSLQALEEMPFPSGAALEALRAVLEEVEKTTRELERKMVKSVTHSFGDLYSLLCSIKGIGKKTAMELIVITHGFKRFATAKQLVAYVGLCPRIYESGTSVRGRPRMVKLGMSRTRRLLYMCAQAAMGSNAACGALYARLKGRGKPGKLALMAVAHKLIRQAFAVAKSGKPYTDGYDSSLATACT